MNKAIFFRASVTAALLTSSSAFAALPGDAVLAATFWQGTTVKSHSTQDVTALNGGFIGLARYDADANRYEFFDKATGQTRDDKGVYFVTRDGKKRILISQTKGYNAIVDMTLLVPTSFIYERIGKVDANTDGEVSVAHVPYQGQLDFTSTLPALTKKTGEIDRSQAGIDILAANFWQGMVALDANGNDVSAFNQNFLGLARYDAQTGKYEFFDKQTGKTRGDYGYFDVIRDNKIRAHVSIGAKYAAVLELTELNAKKFTYARKGKDKEGKEIEITVEHIPYHGKYPLAFTF